MSIQNLLLEIIGTLIVFFGLSSAISNRVIRSSNQTIDQFFDVFKQRED